jgi:hypothetical protein
MEILVTLIPPDFKRHAYTSRNHIMPHLALTKLKSAESINEDHGRWSFDISGPNGLPEWTMSPPILQY